MLRVRNFKRIFTSLSNGSLGAKANILNLNPSNDTHAILKPTSLTNKSILKQRRNQPSLGCNKHYDFIEIEGVRKSLTEADALFEAHRCLKCADAPCQHSCPTQLNVKSFISAIHNKNYYGAAQDIFSDNPLGLTCGMVCPASKLCEGSCNLHGSSAGPIDISGLQQFAAEIFQKMNFRQVISPEIASITSKLSSYRQPKIALIGSGPSSISCATFLARLGYTNITLFEREHYAGGLSTSEIPQFRLPHSAVSFELRLLSDLGVKTQFGKTLSKDFTIETLLKDFQALFIGIGVSNPKTDPVFENLNSLNRVYTSKNFLPRVSSNSKPTLKQFMEMGNLPKLNGHVLILGAGDTAMDCASSAFRCGAERVTIVLRKAMCDMRASPEEQEPVKDERCELLPYSLPKRVLLDDERKVVGMEFYRTQLLSSNNSSSLQYKVVDKKEYFTVNAQHIITAFGSKNDDAESLLHPLRLDSHGLVEVSECMETSVKGVWSGGDITGSSTTVQATNDGKTAAWYMHEYIQKVLYGKQVLKEPKLPRFYTPVDQVDISVKFAGLKFKNPFGLASAPPTTSISMIKRAYEQGQAFAVTKTFCLDKDTITNVSPRITRGGTAAIGSYGPNQSSFINIELISEKSAEYQCKGLKELRDKFPSHITIASIMCGFNKADQQELAKRSEVAGAHALELNLSCPHGMGEKGMGLACGQLPELVKTICQQVFEAVSIPFFAKLTPNITEIVDIAKAAQEGGAMGVTAINTVSGLVPIGTARPLGMSVGNDSNSRYTTFGGLAGNAVKPVALRDVTNIASKVPKLLIMGAGGVDSADTALEFIRNGAGLVQVCSAVMNQDFTVIKDYLSGLKTRLYMMNHPDFQDQNGQSPPLSEYSDVEIKEVQKKQLPNFGSYRDERIRLRSSMFSQSKIGKEGQSVNRKEESSIVNNIPSINSLIGIDKLKNSSLHSSLKTNEQVYARVNEEHCLNCGKCYMACNDSGYQAINFDSNTHLPEILKDKCTGCGLCISVCPATANGCIVLENRNDENQRVDRN